MFQNHRYNLRPRITSSYLNVSVKNESPKSFFDLIKGLEEKSGKKEFTSRNSTQNPDMSDSD